MGHQRDKTRSVLHVAGWFALALTSCTLERSLGAGPAALIGAEAVPPTSMAVAVRDAGSGLPTVSSESKPAAAMPPAVPSEPALTAFDQTGPGNPAGLTEPEVRALMGGGEPGEMQWRYPYDGTVFPGGSTAPLVMWSGNGPADAVYLRVFSRHFEYRGVLKPSFEEALFIPPAPVRPGMANDTSWKFTREPQKQAVIPQFVWDAASAQTLGGREPFTIELSERVANVVHGPLRVQVIIARGALQGSIYYNSCYAGNAADPGVDPQRIGARVMRIPPRGNAEVVSSAGVCTGCHSLASGGARMVTQRAFGYVDAADRAGHPEAAADRYTYALTLPMLPQAKPDLTAGARIGAMGAYGALYPDGSMYLAASGTLDAGYLAKAEELQRPTSAQLMDAVSGAVVSGTGIPADVVMPMFAPDGHQLVFNDAKANGYRLALMRYDTQAHRATAYRTLVEDDAAQKLRPGWPSFLPDGNAVIFVRTDSENFTSKLTVAPNAIPATSDLYIADVRTGTVTMLARAMGFPSVEAGKDPMSYLPFGMDQHRNHFPTVSPAAAGGYFWVFFDSARNFGSMGPMRTLWGAAIDIHPDGSYTSDPSHPPFYVSGQEFINTGHFRAFAALNRCTPDGESCASGIDCCGGVCSSGVCAIASANACARRQERCSVHADCCDQTDLCINSFCSLVELL